MKIINSVISKKDLFNSEVIFDGPMIKAVVDVKNNIIAIDSNMHYELEQELLKNNSKQDDLWGINLYPEQDGVDFIEFDSMINIRPRQNNRSRDVENGEIKEKIIKIINEKIV